MERIGKRRVGERERERGSIRFPENWPTSARLIANTSQMTGKKIATRLPNCEGKLDRAGGEKKWRENGEFVTPNRSDDLFLRR